MAVPYQAMISPKAGRSRYCCLQEIFHLLHLSCPVVLVLVLDFFGAVVAFLVVASLNLPVWIQLENFDFSNVLRVKSLDLSLRKKKMMMKISTVSM